MSSEELSVESEWHRQEASKLFDEVARLREAALNAADDEADAMLHNATELEAEGDAHLRQSNLLDTLIASRLSEKGVGVVERTAKA